jgi:putative tryptophan/tyrosine transport system substrate-binding protein
MILFDQFKRREFITLLGGAAAWPLAALGQQGERVRRIGVLMAATADDPEYQPRIRAFQQGLAALGWVDGRNVRVDTRWAGTNADDIRKHAVELAALAPDAIVGGSGTTTVAPLLQATRTVPIVFVVVIDPVGAGFVSSLARPGGNATGFLMFEYGQSGKWLEVLKQIAPGVKRVAVLRDPTIASGIGQLGAIQSAAPSLGDSDQRTRCRRDRAQRRRIGAFVEWRRGHHGEPRGVAPS